MSRKIADSCGPIAKRGIFIDFWGPLTNKD